MSPTAWKTVRHLEDVIASRYREALALSDIARAVGRNGAYLSALYRKARKRTITSYITELRVRHAEALLVWESLTVLEVAAASGFGSVSRFYEAFAKITGHAPRCGTTATPPLPRLAVHALWVDDTPENNIHERRALNALGIAVDSFVSSTQARTALAHGGYALVISDVRRRDKDDSSWEFARHVRTRYPHVPLLFYCGYADRERRRMMREVGATGLFTREEDLLDAVRLNLDGANAGSQRAKPPERGDRSPAIASPSRAPHTPSSHTRKKTGDRRKARGG